MYGYNHKNFKITIVLTCDTEDGPWLSDQWFEHDLMQEIGCCSELYQLESIKVEEVENDAT